MSTREDIGTSDTLIGSLLGSISEVIRSLESLQAETEKFLECACYFYRVSVVLMEIQTAESNVICSIDIFESLSESIDAAKDLVEKSQESNGHEPTTDLRSIEAGFEGVVKQMGETLQSISESTFDEEEYIGVVIQSLSNEMQNANIGDGSKSEMIQNEQQNFSAKDTPEIVSEQIETDLYPTDPEFSYESYMMYSESQSQMTEIPDIPSQSTNVSSQRYGNLSESQSQITEIPDIPSQSTNVSSQRYGNLSESQSQITEIPDTLRHSTSSHRKYGNLSESQSQITELPDIPSQSTNASSQRKYGNLSESLSMLPQVTQFMEPPYQAFICPLTKEIMEDPVTTETGVTCERKAVTEWFERFANSDEISCPVTGQKLTTELTVNVVLKTIIQEWKVRNEAARIKVAHAALSLGGSESMVIDALRDLQMTCEGKEYNKVQVREAGIIQLLDRYLTYRSKDVRYELLQLLRTLADEDADDGKEMIVKTITMSRIIKFLGSSHQPVRHVALALLLELSKSQHACEKIGSATGAILMLVTAKYNRELDAFASETSDQILRNLEKCPENIKQMAESGLLEPLLGHLAEGSEETQVAMAAYLVEIDIGHEKKTYVAEKACPALIGLVKCENIDARRAAFKALAHISLYHPNNQILVEVGIIKIMVEEMFTKRVFSDLMNSRNEAATILANILESGLEHETFEVNTHGHTLGSDYFVYNIIHMLKNSSPDDLNIDLIRILLSLSKSPKAMATIVSVIKETDASFAMIELINNPHEELGVGALKLLIALTPYIGHTLSERLCKTRGQPENLIQCPIEANQITEKHAVSAKLLAKLPHQNLTLNLALVNESIVSKILHAIHLIQRSGTRTSRYATDFLEGLVGILVRFTTTLYEPQMMYLARNHDLTSVFVDLLMKTSSDQVQRLSATGLENLSSTTMTLSRPPQPRSTKFMGSLSMPRSFSLRSSKKKQIEICAIHKGVCSAKSTFCLVEANAITKLLACLQSDKVEVVESALAAICTLLDDKVDVEKSLSMLSEMNAVQLILNAVKEHKKESLLQKAFWMIDKFIIRGGDKYASDISQDRMLSGMLVSAFHRGDGNTRQMAENILRRLEKMPSFSTYIT
ncbi:PREDICTED: putative U-box domain-containing protein 42 isoform X3 [Camelina sativa]|uniref:RING-type E3 ubiquitin transferase n=1 Tax=Camelina sativa TaxID=90675 RepID=A0ABM0Z8I4_CAMSA|nr:PREDICTED: putative U-box domain-containing protein 42 isoform X2 [Camelina sativa]XP_010511921.1 PREDICTED: putative U-box domain-containing protein 42 isoform X3 [Camelina sativa]